MREYKMGEVLGKKVKLYDIRLIRKDKSKYGSYKGREVKHLRMQPSGSSWDITRNDYNVQNYDRLLAPSKKMVFEKPSAIGVSYIDDWSEYQLTIKLYGPRYICD